MINPDQIIYQKIVCPRPGCKGKLEHPPIDILIYMGPEGYYEYLEYSTAEYSLFCSKCGAYVCTSLHPTLPLKCGLEYHHVGTHYFGKVWEKERNDDGSNPYDRNV